jgi:wyosine [tRNA(Phe)-imidazoG37] synthetase (radical SAM superfamily)
MKNKPVASLTRILREQDDQGSHVGRRLVNLAETSQRTLTPPFPRQIQLETTNICNHSCSFCAYPAMQREHGTMDKALFRRVVAEAYQLGAREIGLFAGAEPLAYKGLEEMVAYCASLGYEYQYISTNGALGSPERFRKLMDAGLGSIKFSINAGTRESYRRVHGRDDFDKVLANLRFVSEYRRGLGRPFFLGVSFVAMDETAAEFEALKAQLGDAVDEVIYYEANNQSGQMEGLPLVPFSECALPFNKLHVSLEGYVKACCNDYDNLLAIEDVKAAGLMAAWHSPRFQQLRQRHLDDDLQGTLCGKCLRGHRGRAAPLNETLGTRVVPVKVVVTRA